MFELKDLQLIRIALDHITIKGADAKTLSSLQNKVENELFNLQSPQTASKEKETKKLLKG